MSSIRFDNHTYHPIHLIDIHRSVIPASWVVKANQGWVYNRHSKVKGIKKEKKVLLIVFCKNSTTVLTGVSVFFFLIAVGVCNFEKDSCGFTQDKSDNFDWTRMKGSTSTPGTGPQVDHTLGSRRGRILFLNK